MAVVHLSVALRTSILTAIQSALDAGSDGAAIEIYKGVMAADITTAATSTNLLGTLYMPTACATAPGSITSSALTIGTITQDSSADRDGTASWARISSKSGAVLTPVVDIDVSNTGGTGVLQMNTVNVVALGPILINSLVFTVS